MATTSVLDSEMLYLTDDRVVCGDAMCAGSTAMATGKTIHGVTLIALDDPEFVAVVCGPDESSVTCQCGKVTMTR